MVSGTRKGAVSLGWFLALLGMAGAACGQDASVFNYAEAVGTGAEAFRLPEGMGMLLYTLIRVIAVWAVLLGISIAYELQNAGSGRFTKFEAAAYVLGGIGLWHIVLVLKIVHNTIPFIPDMSHVFF